MSVRDRAEEVAGNLPYSDPDAVMAAIEAALVAERQRAAEICEGLVTFAPEHEKYAPTDANVPCGWCDGLEKAAAAIRTGEEE